MQPKRFDRPAVDSVQRQAINFDLRRVARDPFRQLAGGQLVGFEIQNPNLLGQYHCQIDRALDNKEFIRRQVQTSREFQVRQVR